MQFSFEKNMSSAAGAQTTGGCPVRHWRQTFRAQYAIVALLGKRHSRGQAQAKLTCGYTPHFGTWIFELTRPRQRRVVREMCGALIALLIVSLLWAMPVSAQCMPGPNQIALFEHRDYGGRCAIREVGAYPNASAMGLENDSVSSLRVGGNVWATVCHHNNYKGLCGIFGADLPTLHGTAIGNDQVSSLKVGARPVVSLPQSIFVGRTSREQLLGQDLDRDGLNDELEAILAEQLKPTLVFDEDENARREQEPIVLFQMRPLNCVGADCPVPVRLALRWAFLFVRDGGYGPGTGRAFCGSDDHQGDNDFATFQLKSQDRGQSWTLTSVLLSGNPAAIKGTIGWPGEREWVELNRAHPLIHMSTGKHHMFLHEGDWDDSPYSDVSIWDDCGDDVDSDGATVQPNLRSVESGVRANNVGEPERHSPVSFVDDLSAHFSHRDCASGRSAWSTENFCSDKAKPNAQNWLATRFSYGPQSFCSRIVQCTPPRRCCVSAVPRPGCPSGCVECSGATGVCR